ncbi:MAG: secondary thiamine-phosphate synthase enzyme YjbQ [Bacillota bacterium]|jgi:secondary thiamine-phosphate synthase enzyme
MNLHKLTVKTSRRTEMIDLTSEIEAVVAQSGVEEGLCCVYVPHTTAGVTINENADPTVCRDIETVLETLIPWNGPYTHSEGNSAAHLKSSLMGCSQTLIIEKGRLALGTWQGVYLAEFDGPRQRQVWVKILEG